MRTFLTSSVYAWLILSVRVTAAPFVDEEFATDPVASNRFEQVTFGTESSFTHNQASQNLTAILDVDHDPAYYLSTPFTPITASDDASFSVTFRIVALDNRVLPTALIGFLSTNHVNLNGDGGRGGRGAGGHD